MKKIGIIGTESMGKVIATEIVKQHLVDDMFVTQQQEEKVTNMSDLMQVPYMITRTPEFPQEVWIDPSEPVYNHKKHLETCAKNRRKRKKKKKK